MSRWSASPLRIALAPGEAALLRAHGEPASRVLGTPERSAASLLPLLDEALSDPAWHGRQVEVVLSQHFVRHVLTPPPGKALRRDEERALVLASLREIYGDIVDQWSLQVVSQPPHYGLLGAAVDAEFMRQLEALLARHGFRTIRIRPLASVAAQRLPKTFQGWWALAEPGWLSLFAMQHGVWRHVAGLPADAHWCAALPELIEREADLDALPAPSAVWVQTAGAGAATLPPAAHGRWQLLPCDPQAQGALALARV